MVCIGPICLDFDDEVEEDRVGRFHVLNLAAGARIELETEGVA